MSGESTLRPTASESELTRWRAVAIEICDEADRLSLAGFRRGVKVDTKPDRSFVTEVDRSIERMARERLRAEFPGCGFVGEEEGSEATGASLVWYIDPIDATANFVRGINIYATLLAVALDGEIQLGVVSAPAMRERWLAWRGGGTWRSTERITVSKIGRIEDSHLIYAPEGLASGTLPGFQSSLAAAWRERGFGDFWGYMLVAEGAAEAMIEIGAHPWDWAAPSIIVEEAGGVFTDATGVRRIDGPTVVASNGLIHQDLLRSLEG